jgi:protein-S-isoprenylcysteine O-methyltransferase Ste14
MTILGLALVLAAVLVFGSHRVVTGEERPDHVIDTGPFRYVRHPLYLAALLAYIGAAVSSASLLSLALLVPVFVFYDYIARYEERVLEVRFGAAYRDYEARTGRWLPGVSRRPAGAA